MKKLLILSALLFFGISTAQDLEGSWTLIEVNGDAVTNQETVRIYQDGYFAYGKKKTSTNEFIEAGGGEYETKNGYSERYDFNTADNSMVGKRLTYEIKEDDSSFTLTTTEGKTQTWKRISSSKNDLSGNWVITGRQRNGELNRSTPGDRRTIKILSGDRFQWVAFNSKTKEFSGTGGGTYTAQDGKYTENIEFFSRDDSRVGASLDFDYKVEDGEWHHSGKSSKGEPIYEIWSPYAEAYKK
ncbi:hypothetical protein [Salinimicrobium oceani]|uniref:Membrane or secreted protein n=1 Tax=Salinimicrobium oceani TaxID=2722702 RepID=A0ABX1D162_9FLAO|nr:hypothetical protein [Salinimicrobium oceani]NJW52903.1 hypothetical protein [Salinimicrobium oceani]